MLPDDPRHGSMAGYRAGCRLDCCRSGIARYNEGRRLLHLRGEAGPRFVDPRGTVRRVQALAALGWSPAEVSRQMGRHKSFLTHAINRYDRIRPSTAAAVAKVYEALSMQRPMPTTKHERMAVTKTLRLAERNQWVPPLAWDDIDNDDYPYNSDGHPVDREQDLDHAAVWRVLQGDRVPTTGSERREILRIWLNRGGSERELCRRMGWKEGRYSPSTNPQESCAGRPSVGTPRDHFQDERKAS